MVFQFNNQLTGNLNVNKAFSHILALVNHLTQVQHLNAPICHFFDVSLYLPMRVSGKGL